MCRQNLWMSRCPVLSSCHSLLCLCYIYCTYLVSYGEFIKKDFTLCTLTLEALFMCILITYENRLAIMLSTQYCIEFSLRSALFPLTYTLYTVLLLLALSGLQSFIFLIYLYLDTCLKEPLVYYIYHIISFNSVAMMAKYLRCIPIVEFDFKI